MVEQALGFCRRNMKTRTIIDKKTGARNDKTEYPVDALREAILNAVIHRDYSIHTEGTPVQIDFFTDRVEIHSPGSLYGRMSVEQLGIAKPDLRNPALAVMTEMLTEAEHRYSGIPTMRNAMKEYGLPEPKFENRRNEFVVTLYNNGASMETSDAVESGKNLLEFCREPKTRQEIADYLNIETIFYAMQHYVQPLIVAGKLAMTMPEKPKSRNQKFYTVKQNNYCIKAGGSPPFSCIKSWCYRSPWSMGLIFSLFPSRWNCSYCSGVHFIGRKLCTIGRKAIG